MQIMEAEFEGHGAAFFPDFLVSFVFHFLDDLCDAGRSDSSVGDQLFNRLLRDLPPIWIESRQDDGAGRVVDDEVDPGGKFEGADVTSLAADDPALQIVAG